MLSMLSYNSWFSSYMIRPPCKTLIFQGVSILSLNFHINFAIHHLFQHLKYIYLYIWLFEILFANMFSLYTTMVDKFKSYKLYYMCIIPY